MVLNECHRREWLKRDFWSQIKIKADTEVKKGTTKDEIKEIITKLDFNNYAQFRDGVCILLMWETGVRIGTIAGLTFDMVDTEEELIRFEGKIMKNHQALTLPVTKVLLGLIIKLYEINSKSFDEKNFLFISTGGVESYDSIFIKRICKYRKLWGIKNINAHSIRRGFAKNLLDNDVPLVYISKALNHKSLDTTTKYLYIDEQDVINDLRMLKK